LDETDNITREIIMVNFKLAIRVGKLRNVDRIGLINATVTKKRM